MSKLLISVSLMFALVGCKTESKTTKSETPTVKTSETNDAPKQAKKVPSVPKMPACKPSDDECFIKQLGNVKVGPFETGGKVSSLEKQLGVPDAKTERIEMGATGDIVENWTWLKKGISMQLLAPDMKAEPNTILSITMMVPSTFKTDRGIGIGSTLAEVQKAYVGTISAPLSKDDQPTIIAGSVFDGIFFQFADGKVKEIFVGAGAE